MYGLQARQYSVPDMECDEIRLSTYQFQEVRTSGWICSNIANADSIIFFK